MLLMLLIVVTLALAAANGANDNIKGAATLVGSGMVGYRNAIAFATVATAVGGVASIFLANGLLAAFSGKGIVPQEVTASLPFLLAVATGAGMTVWLASWTGMPVSTTHALLGGLLGAGIAVAPQQVDLAVAAQAMLLPLLIAPLVALALALMLIPAVRRLRARPAQSEPCFCSDVEMVAAGPMLVAGRTVGRLGTLDEPACQPAQGRAISAFHLGQWLDRSHLGTAAAVSFARGLNDTPKIAALMVAGSSLGVGAASTAVVAAMALGGVLASRRVSDTLACKLTRMDAGEGLGGNLVTSVLVIGASPLGLPVSTTHVATGALFGIAAGNGTGRVAVIRQILLAWCLTLPVATALAFATALQFR
jgi:inorganic phosphate transporter, PiT family